MLEKLSVLSYLKTSTAFERFIRQKPLNSSTSTPPSIGHKINEWVDCPPISEEEVQDLQRLVNGKITRHIKRDFLEDARKGYFRFGTLLGYRPQDQSLIGRFSDVQEASQMNFFRSRSSIYNYYGSGHTIQDCLFIGFDYGLLIEFFCNDYCSCSSRSSFNLIRALNLRARGNPDVGAYVVYDFNKLIAALKEILEEKHPHLSLIYQRVIYGDKDRYWDIEGYHDDIISKDKLAIWLGIAYVKSVDYSHEEEIRIMIIDKNSPGGLPEKNKFLEFNDERIANSIVDYGIF